SYIYHGSTDPFDNNQVSDCAPFPTTSVRPFLCRIVQQATTDTNGSQSFSATLDASLQASHRLFTYNARGQLLGETRPPALSPEYQLEYYEDTTVDWTIGD